MKFWDSSAIVPIVSGERQSPRCQKLLRQDPGILVWVLTRVEVQSALARKRRGGEISRTDLREARKRLGKVAAGWNEVLLAERLLGRAVQLLDLHDLRAADALQLAAAWTASGEEPSRLPFVTLDERMLLAAEREGFPVIEPQ